MSRLNRATNFNLKKSYGKDEIFQVNFWSNTIGSTAINAVKNREEAEAILLFGQTYFPDFFPSLHPEVHTDMLALMVSQNKLKAVAVPRGHSKSTVVSFLLVIYRIVFQERRFIVIVSESEEKAKDFVVRIRGELEHNRKLRRDFGKDGDFKTADWAKTDFTTATRVRVVAKGAGQSLRGMIFEDTRPDMIVLDDIETDESAGTPAITNYILTNVLPAVNKRGVYDICYVGTIIKDMATLHLMLINSEWASAKWEALDENGEMIAPMLLPEEEYKKTKKMYSEMGKMSLFYAELHNNPMVADDEMTFKPEYFQDYNQDGLPDGLRYFISYDPAMPPSGRTKLKRVDRSAIVVIGVDHKKNWYVTKIVANRATPSDNRKLLYKLVDKYEPSVVWMETIAAQRSMYLEIKEEMKRKNIKFPLREIPSHSGSKEARIEQLQPLYEAGLIYHNGKDELTEDLQRELLLFGRTPHDDISDALSFFLNKITYPQAPVTISKKKVRDFYDNFFQDDKEESWRVV